jgi:hypothetical protein
MGGIVMAPPEVGACGPLAPAPVRRLNRWEYGGSIRALFPKSFPANAEINGWRYDDHQLAFKRPANAEASNLHIVNDMYKDPATHGFENRARKLNPTDLLLETYDDYAIMIAEQATRDGSDQFLPCTEKTLDCGKKFIDSFGKKAFRRPLASDEKDRYYKYFDQEMKDGGSFDAAVHLTLQLFLQAPQFLYRIELGDPSTRAKGAIRLTPWETASRLSYLFWMSSPDDELFAAAEGDKLKTPDQIGAQAERMLGDPRFRYTAVEFFRQWGDFERGFTESYRLKPGFNQSQMGHGVNIFYLLAARDEAQRFTEWSFTEGNASAKELLTDPTTFSNNYLDDLYAGRPPLLSTAIGAPTKKTVNTQQRSGYLTRALFNWTYAHFEGGVPPLRGHFVVERVLCDSFPAPPADALSVKRLDPDGPTNRDEFEAKVKARDDCPVCHNKLDGIGFTFEHYNNTGGYRTTDNGAPVDATGTLLGTDVDGPVKNAIELSAKLGNSALVRQCFLRQWYEHAVGRDAEGAIFPGRSKDGVDVCRLNALDKVLMDNNGDVRKALVEYAKSPDFIWRPDVSQ